MYPPLQLETPPEELLVGDAGATWLAGLALDTGRVLGLVAERSTMSELARLMYVEQDRHQQLDHAGTEHRVLEARFVDLQEVVNELKITGSLPNKVDSSDMF